MKIVRKLAKVNPKVYLPDVADTLHNLGNLHQSTNELKKAEAEYGEALKIRRKLAEANPAAYLPYVAETLHNLGVLHGKTNELEKQEAEYGEALEKYRKLAEVNPEAYLPDIALILINFAMFYLESKPNRERSVVLTTEAIKILMPFVERVPVTRKYRDTARTVLRKWGLSDEEIAELISK